MSSSDRYLFFMQIPETKGATFVKQAQQCAQDVATVCYSLPFHAETLSLWRPGTRETGRSVEGDRVSEIVTGEVARTFGVCLMTKLRYCSLPDACERALGKHSSIIIATRQDIIPSLKEYGFITAHASAPDTPLNLGARFDSEQKFKELIFTSLYAQELRNARK